MVVDIHCRFLFETEVFARRQRRTLGVSELNEMMQSAQADAYGDGLDQSTAHPHMWVVKPHYYGSHFYNWPYTYGLLFGLGLFAQYRADPERFQAGYDDVLSRAGMNTAEELGAAFGLDVTGEAFWTASLDVIGARIDQYDGLAAEGLGERRRLRREPRASWPSNWTVNRAYRLDQMWQGLYEQLATPDELTDAAEGIARHAGRRTATRR